MPLPLLLLLWLLQLEEEDVSTWAPGLERALKRALSSVTLWEEEAEEEDEPLARLKLRDSADTGPVRWNKPVLVLYRRK